MTGTHTMRQAKKHGGKEHKMPRLARFLGQVQKGTANLEQGRLGGHAQGLTERGKVIGRAQHNAADGVHGKGSVEA